MERLFITEQCPNCEAEVTLLWDMQRGLSAFCPVCGKRLMLCSECVQGEQSCDYDSATDSCKHNKSNKEKPLYVIQRYHDGYFWCGMRQWSKQLRKAQVYTSLRLVNDVISRETGYGCRILRISMSIIGEI